MDFPQTQLELQDVQPQVVGSSACGSVYPSRNHDQGASENDEEGVGQEMLTWEEKKWSLFLSAACFGDLFVSGILIIISLTYAYRDNGVSLYCLGIQSFSHLISSLLLLLRFLHEYIVMRASSSDLEQGLLKETRRKHLVREQGFNITMGIVMLISSIALLFKAFRKFRFWTVWYLDHVGMDEEVEWATEFLSWYGFIFYGVQAIFRVVVAKRLARSVIWHAFVASIVSLLFFFVLAVAATYEKEWSWKAEPIAAIALSFVTLVEGVRFTVLNIEDVDERLQRDSRA